MNDWIVPSIGFILAVAFVVIILRERRSARLCGAADTTDRMEVDEIPDVPVAFGYKTNWLAVQTSQSEAVLDVLGLVAVRRANWETGLDAAYKGCVFVSPPFEGWVFVVGRNLPGPGISDSPDRWDLLMSSLARRFDDVQFFGTHRVSEYHAWARFQGGQEQRAFAYSGGTLVDRGKQTDGEHQLGLKFFDHTSPEANSEGYWEREDLSYPDEEVVMQVAGKWGINPTTLEDREYSVSVGWLGAIRRSSE